MAIKLDGSLTEYGNIAKLLKSVKDLKFDPNVDQLIIDYPSMSTTTLNGKNTRLTVNINNKRYNIYYNRLEAEVINEKLVFEVLGLDSITYYIGNRLKLLKLVIGENINESPLFSLKLPDNSDATVQDNWEKYRNETEIKCYLELKPESEESIIFLGTPYCTVNLINNVTPSTPDIPDEPLPIKASEWYFFDGTPSRKSFENLGFSGYAAVIENFRGDIEYVTDASDIPDEVKAPVKDNGVMTYGEDLNDDGYSVIIDLNGNVIGINDFDNTEIVLNNLPIKKVVYMHVP